LTIGELFDSYDESKIHSAPGVRWDLFPSGKEEGRKRLVMDFFGNVQNVEMEAGARGNDTEWQEDLRRLGDIIRKRKEAENHSLSLVTGEVHKKNVSVKENTSTKPRKHGGPVKVEAGPGWSQQLLGAATLLSCALIWGGASWLESSQSKPENL
ncbi:MAG: hypothetical protein Q9187_009377, partial [Circinaria calcarea]